MLQNSNSSCHDGVADHSHTNGSEEAPFRVSFPQKHGPKSLQQDEEYAEVDIGKEKQQIRIHDYNTMYAHPGLYEYIVHDLLACDSPRILVQLLRQHLASPESNNNNNPIVRPLDILDVAAGNGIVGAQLRNQLTATPGIRTLVGTDLLDSARSAALRDRPHVYDDYVTADLIHPHGSQQLPSSSDVVVICAALGPSDTDLPLEAVDRAIALLRTGGLLALTVNAGDQRAGDSPRWQNFMANVNGSGGGCHWGGLEEVARQRYPHRKNVHGERIEYTALIYKKKSLTSEALLVDGNE